MKHLIHYLVFAASLLPLGLGAKGKLADYLPADSWVVAEVEDLDALKEDLEKGPFGELWDSPAMEKIKKLLDENMLDFPEGEEGEVAKELIERLTTWSEKSTGQVAFSISGLEDVMKLPDDDARQPEIIFLAETEATSKELAELLEWLEETVDRVGEGDDKLRIEKAKVRGHEVFWLTPEDNADNGPDVSIGAFVIDGVLGLGGGRPAIEDLIERMDKNEGESITEHADYRDSFDEIGRGDLRMFVNIRPFIALALEAIRENEDVAIPENPLGVTMDGIIAALGLDGLECMAMQMDFDKRGMEMGVALFMGKRNGLLGLLQSSDQSVTLVPFIPDDSSTAGVARFDLGLMWDTIMDILKDVSPALHIMVDGQIKAFEKQAGVSLRKDVLGSLGDELVSFSKINPEELEIPDEEGPAILDPDLNAFLSEFYAISLKDADRFDQSLRTLLNAVAPGSELFNERKHKGVVVRMLSDQADMSFSYAVTPKWLFVNMGDHARMLKAISRSQKPRKSLWQRPDVAAAMKDLPREYNQLDYTDLEVLVDLLMPLMQQAIEEAAGESFDLEELPELPFFILGWGRDVRRGIVSRIKIFPKDKR